ncbi:response regulator transcription factor [Paenibacillus kobensis]|uniref:response regulator transcription factor n=1 Tax=Paenibacillus kobensis TaxID=59841 RepID=UPI000FDA010E|nr:helix-turn-helix transcriptional regulator [Paenibacillus kobensis]
MNLFIDTPHCNEVVSPIAMGKQVVHIIRDALASTSELITIPFLMICIDIGGRIVSKHGCETIPMPHQIIAGYVILILPRTHNCLFATPFMNQLVKHITFKITNTKEAIGPALLALGLTNKEHEIANLWATDLTRKEIAQALYLSEETIRSHIKSIYRKLEVSTRIQFIRKYNKFPNIQ